MTLEQLTEGFDYLSPEDGAELNNLQERVTFELEDAAPQEPLNFDLMEYAAAIESLTEAQLDTFIETVCRPNPKRRVRRNGGA